MQIQDEINSKYIIFETKLEGRRLTVPIDAPVTKELVIECLSEGVLEWIGDIFIPKEGGIKQAKIDDNPFKTADQLLK